MHTFKGGCRGPILIRYPAEPAPHADRWLISRSVLTYHTCIPRAEIPAAVTPGTGVLLKICEWSDVVLLGKCKTAVVHEGSTWITNVFLFTCIHLQDFLGCFFFFPSGWGRAENTSFLLSPLLTRCCLVYLQKMLQMQSRIMTSWPSPHLLLLHGAVTCRGQDWPRRDRERSSTQPGKRRLLARFGDSASRQSDCWRMDGTEVHSQPRAVSVNHRISWDRAMSWRATEIACQETLLSV